jgi:hypothetical protein
MVVAVVRVEPSARSWVGSGNCRAILGSVIEEPPEDGMDFSLESRLQLVAPANTSRPAISLTVLERFEASGYVTFLLILARHPGT